MKKLHADVFVLSALDDIAWLFNIRGNDVDYNPVFLAHLLIDAEHAQLFIHEGKVDEALAQTLAADGIELIDYDRSIPVLQSLPAESSMLIDPARVTLSMSQSSCGHTIEQINPSQLFKSQKDYQL